MKVISIDDEKIILEDFVDMLNGMPEVDEAVGFTNGKKALDYLTNNDVDVAFCDIQMRGMDGIELAKKIKLVKPNVNIIFLTAYSEYSLDAMKMHASGYILKPAIEEDVRRELNDLRLPVAETGKRRFRAQCFGNFEVYIDDVPCKFKYAKTKELVAYIIDRHGALCTNGEILGVLWEDSEVTASLENYLRNLVSDLRKVLDEAGLQDVIVKQKGQIGIASSQIECDYYRWLEGDESVGNLFSGEYMAQYSWAEETLASIELKMWNE